MKWLISILLVLTAAVSFALLAYDDPGFVIVGRGAWTLETSLTVFMVLLGLCFVGLFFLLRGLMALWYLPERWQSSYQSKMRGRAQLALQRGFSALLEGDWKAAEKSLLQSQPQYLHYMCAAYAAQQRQDIEQRDSLLRKAQETAPAEYRLAVALAQAKLQLMQRQMSLAQTTLKSVQEQHPKHPQVLRLLAHAYEAQQAWQALHALLPELRKRKALSETALQRLELQTVQGELARAGTESLEALKIVWERLPKVNRLQPAVAKVYVQYLLQQGATELAEPLLRDTLKQHWDKDLLHLYAHLNVNAAQQLKYAEAWLKQHEKDADLLRALGQLSMRNSLWGKAQQYLEASLGLSPRAETYKTLGDLLKQMGEIEQAAENYRKGLNARSRAD